MAAQPDQDNEIIVIDDREEDKHLHKRPHSPWEKDESSVKGRFYKRKASPSPIRRGRSREKNRARSKSRERSREYYRKSLSPRESSRSKDGPPERYMRGVSRSRDHNREDRSYSREKRSPSQERLREKREYERKRMEYRESSFERDLKGKERIRTIADLPWEREKRMLFRFSNL